MPSRLFTPIALDTLQMQNRIVIAPMCQYSADNGKMTDWHMMHYGNLAQSGAGILTIEATAILPEGRISYADVGLYDDATEAAMGDVLQSIRRWSDMPVAIQISHAGRKASSARPWDGGGQIASASEHGWPTVAPSPLAYQNNDEAPHMLDREALARIRQAFAATARRAARLGIDAIQLHGAHGYLLHQFLSPLSNQRTDDYGGSAENRMRFPLEVFHAVREVFPADRPVTVRLSATDWVENGWTIDDTVVFSKMLEDAGAAAIHISSGGLSPQQKIAVGPGYQVPFSRKVRNAVSIPVVAVGLITEFDQAEAILQSGDADMIAIARGILYDPRWPWHAAAHFGETITVAGQYLRCQPRAFAHLFTRR
ncbi:NADH:flavin oxidoreductase/NADH oxidase [Martelella alba]|uniref:NADH:flavin oxidoreductase/NADH oxidase n=1 Tax=Martelella alba TaxID=2590451 RepID=A0A506U1H3_9HYPH|nr:NADH:flavin oxidoreductase/NADH oxidase [Martelella alba]TPW27091.1 NADH:flavin oxidoreductase/NADH oxidase [Martelella alba]